MKLYLTSSKISGAEELTAGCHLRSIWCEFRCSRLVLRDRQTLRKNLRTSKAIGDASKKCLRAISPSRNCSQQHVPHTHTHTVTHPDHTHTRPSDQKRPPTRQRRDADNSSRSRNYTAIPPLPPRGLREAIIGRPTDHNELLLSDDCRTAKGVAQLDWSQVPRRRKEDEEWDESEEECCAVPPPCDVRRCRRDAETRPRHQ